MKKILTGVLLGLFGLFVGGLSALWMAGLLDKSGLSGSDISLNDWSSDWSIGSSSASAYTRARVARHGLLALTKSEAVYFTRAQDDEGAPLREACTYRLSGEDQLADWWSITLYDKDSRLPMNTDEALSIDATSVADRNAWTAQISPRRSGGGDWLSSRAAGTFDLTLRLYRPAESLLDKPLKTLNPPRVEKLSCEGDGA